LFKWSFAVDVCHLGEGLEKITCFFKDRTWKWWLAHSIQNLRD
jgi:hypothetical protein